VIVEQMQSRVEVTATCHIIQEASITVRLAVWFPANFEVAENEF